MREHHLEARRTARYYTLDPAGAPRAVWFVLHGYGQLAAYFARHFEAIRDDRLVVAPEALSRFYLEDHRRVGASWMTREDRQVEIDDYLAFLDGVYDRVFETLDPESVPVTALGFSQATATVSRWAVLGRAKIDRLILWAGGLAHDLDLGAHAEALRRLRLTFVVGSQDALVTPQHVAAQEAVLSAHKIPSRLVPFDGDHRLDADVLRALAEE